MQPVLELNGVAKLYGRTVALRATSLRVEPGETLALLGPNGSGKTTLLKIMAGAVTPSLGTGSILGRDMRRERAPLRAEIGLMASDSYLYDDLSARENLRFIVVMMGRKPLDADITEALRFVGLSAQAKDRVRTFSSGMKRRMSLARLLLQRPRLLLLDEPYNSLDGAGADLVDAFVRELGREGTATVLATHDAERGLALADRVAVLERGHIRHLGSAAAYRMEHRVG